MLTLNLNFDHERFDLTGDYENEEGQLVFVGESGPFSHLRQGVKFYIEQGAEIVIFHILGNACTPMGMCGLDLLEAPKA